MAIQFSASNLFDIITYISTFLLGFTFILLSFINGEPIKPIVYLGSLLSTMMLVVFFLKFKTKEPIPISPICNMWSILDDTFYRPSMSTYFIIFTFFYTLIPMIITSNMNYWLMTFIIIIFSIDTVGKKFIHKCMTWTGLIISIITGGVFGSIISFGIYSSIPELVYFGDYNSNNTQCGKKGKKFVCSVYKNGQIIKNI
jgi:hypothetical protein